MGEDLRSIVARNVVALMARIVDTRENARHGSRGVSKLAWITGFSPGDAARILEGETSLGLQKLETLAHKLSVEPWQLCMPNLDVDALPSSRPSLSLARAAPPLPYSPELVSRLAAVDTLQAEAIEGMLRGLLRMEPLALPETQSRKAG
jgi:hypothetical protein